MSHRHPELHKRWRTSLAVKNETAYDTRAIRRLVLRALKAIVLPARGTVRITYSNATHDPYEGSAAIGRTERRSDGSFVTYAGLSMVLTLPRDPTQLDVGKFARVVLHEALHWKGVEHKDMTEDQLWCRGPMPKWAEGVAIPHAVRNRPTPADQRDKRLAHAKVMLAKAETRAKRAQTILKKWKRKVGAIERSMLPKGMP